MNFKTYIYRRITLFSLLLLISSLTQAKSEQTISPDVIKKGAHEIIGKIDQLAEQYKEEAPILAKLSRKRFLFTQLTEKPQFTESSNGIQVPSIFAASFGTNHDKDKKKCNKVKLIRQCNFCGKGLNGIVLNKSGYYKVCENILFKPTQPNVQAITITASNVVLDLDIFRLAQDISGNKQSGVYGIAIARGVHNVKITGSAGVALVLDFTLAGIRVFGNTDQITVQNIIVSQTNRAILTNDIIPVECSQIGTAQIVGGLYVGEGEPLGLAFQGTDKRNRVTNLTIENFVAKRCMFGAEIVMTFGITINNSTFTENSGKGLNLGFVFPIANDAGTSWEFPVAADGKISNCHFDRNEGDLINMVNPGPGFEGSLDVMEGIALNEVEKFVIENCTINDNINTGQVLAVDHDGAHNIVWNNCTAARNISIGGGAPLVGGFGVGFHFSGSIPLDSGTCVGIGDQPLAPDIDIVVKNCQSLNNQGSGNVCGHGMEFFFCRSVAVYDSVANGNFSTGSAAATSVGFHVEGFEPGGQSDSITFVRCTAENNGSENTNVLGAAGFQVRSTSSNVVYRDCTAVGNGNTTRDIPITIAAGFLINSSALATPLIPGPTVNVLYDNCIAIDNGLTLPSAPLFVAGGLAIRGAAGRPPIANVTVQNSTFSYNWIGIATAGEPTNISGLIIKNNKADQNVVAGIDVRVSHPQLPRPLVTGNVAYNNGLNGTNNYLGVPNPAVNVVEVTTDNLPNGTVVGFKNLSIVPVP